MNLSFILPPLPGRSESPVWRESFFAVGQERLRILNYGAKPTGWTDELTAVHEQVDDEGHFINVASREHAVAQVRRWVDACDPLIMDVGCSSGYTIKLLRERMPAAAVAGADCVSGPLENLAAVMPDVPLFLFDLVTCPLPDNVLDAVISLNVLEHIDDDQAALNQLYRILKPGGVAVIEVPAGPGLYDVYDSQLMHKRRYRMREISGRIRKAGFIVQKRSHLGFFLYPGFWLAKKRNRRHLSAPPGIQREIVSRDMRRGGRQPVMHAIMRLEEKLRSELYYPFGIRCLVTCQKPSARQQTPTTEPK